VQRDGKIVLLEDIEKRLVGVVISLLERRIEFIFAS
jgi:hypothetical protein